MKKLIGALVLVFLISSLSACGALEKKVNSSEGKVKSSVNEESKENKENSVIKKDEKKSSTFQLYFSDSDAMYLEAEEREIVTEDPKAVVEELIKGPKNKNLYRTLPEGLKVLDVEVKDKVAYVNLSKDILEKVQGSTGESFAVYSIVNTLVLNKDLKIDKVQLLVEGKKEDTLAGHIDISSPIDADVKMNGK